MILILAAALLLSPMVAAARSKEPVKYELTGRVRPQGQASLSLHSTTSPFMCTAQSDAAGRFRFRGLAAGAYTLAVLLPGRGEARQTIEVGPKSAGPKRRVEVTVDMTDPKVVSIEALQRRAVVSAKELSIPERARREYAEAQKKLAEPDVAAAVAHLEKAVQIAPQYWIAWNSLGTIAYQSHDFPRAENCFREALKQNPAAFEPLVNLGGALLTRGKWNEALSYNTRAVGARPHDALANAQLGMNFYYLGSLDRASEYLAAAKRIDPRHFSHPQLILAEIDVRRHDRQAAARELEDFLRVHPDWPGAESIRRNIDRLLMAELSE